MTTNSTHIITLVGDLVDTVGGRWQVHTTNLAGTNQNLPSAISTNVNVYVNTALANNVSVTGNWTIDGAGSGLDVGAYTLTVSGNITIQNNALITMQNAAGGISAGGNITLNGASTSGYLTAGTVSVGATLYLYNSTFQPSGTHTVEITGTGSATISSNTGTTVFQNLTCKFLVINIH